MTKLKIIRVPFFITCKKKIFRKLLEILKITLTAQENVKRFSPIDKKRPKNIVQKEYRVDKNFLSHFLRYPSYM